MGRGTATPLGVVVEGYRDDEKTPPSVGLSADCHLPVCASQKQGGAGYTGAAPAIVVRYISRLYPS